jgi:hypothetical protein
MLAARPEFLPIMGGRKAVNAQNDDERAQDYSREEFFRSLQIPALPGAINNRAH